MLQRNLFAIIIVSLGLVFTTNDFGQWHPEIDRIKSPRDVATGQVKSPRDIATGIKSPRDIASGQATGIKSNAKTTGKMFSGLITEITFPKQIKQKNSKWELSEYDATKSRSAKPKGYNLGDTATHERRRKG